MRNLKLVVLAVAAVAVVAVIAVGLGGGRDPEAAEAAQREKKFGIERADLPAPPVTLVGADGRPVVLSQLRGQVLFVNFWATWCPPCRDEMPSMLALGRELTSRYPGKFRMVAVSVDEGWEEVREFFRGNLPPEALVVRDPEQVATRAYYCGARGGCPPDGFKFPETYIVDPSGRLVAYIVGPRDWADPAARRFLERLIAG